MISRENTRRLLKDTIAINSMNPDLSDVGQGETELAQYLGDYLKNLGLEVNFQDIDGRKNIIAKLPGNGEGKSIILNAHTDTVGVEGMEDPTNPYEEDGKIYGRGSYDMKGGLVSSILAIKSIVKSDIKLSGEVIFAGVIDEEFGSLGTEALIESYTADAAIICEPTDERIVIANKGFSWIKLTVHGKAAHGSKPHLGIDAISKATDVLYEIKQLNDALSRKHHNLVGAPTIRVAKIEGGLGLSTIADKCEIFIERRTLPHVTREQVEFELEEIITKLDEKDEELDAEFEFIIFRGGMELPEDTEIVQILASEQEKLEGSYVFDGEPWWMDSALMGEHGIPTVVLGPKGDGAHAKIEYVEIDSVMRIATILEKTIINFCK